MNAITVPTRNTRLGNKGFEQYDTPEKIENALFLQDITLADFILYYT